MEFGPQNGSKQDFLYEPIRIAVRYLSGQRARQKSNLNHS
ncbi:hypothetical protein F8B43_1294 [Methylorubrum populi]|uniref:Uncharacterized protein n=1 Tax=Methylorubrum populi TaxID=223967 RepID=A0A833J721_9HYPH|nr:hypothetical protein F8B43_1294 [Methylorubrum populi]